MAEKSASQFMRTIQVPVLLAMGWKLLGFATEPVIPESELAEGISLAGRVALVCAAGYLVTYRRRFGLLAAALAGIVVNFAEHVLVKGGAFLIMGEFEATGGVLISFVMFFWVAMLIGLLGGLLGMAVRGGNAAI